MRAATGPTSFDFELVEAGKRYSMETRANGNIADEEPGEADLAEARRILPLLRAAFPQYRFKPEVVDEWVCIDVELKQPKEAHHG